MKIPQISTRDVEYMVTYPAVGCNPDERVLLMVLNTKDSGRWLVYAPRVVQRNCEMTMDSRYNEYRDARGHTIAEIEQSREVIINNELFALSDNKVFFNLVALDQQYKPTVKKEEVEKLFGCRIDG